MVVQIPRLVVAGLGNYPMPLTRHSVGHVIVNALAARYGIQMKNSRGSKHEKHALIGRGDVVVNGTMVDLTLMISKQLMNISGPSVAAVARHAGVPTTSLIVISDSLSHKVKTLNVRLGGSAEGHNGVKSVIAALGNDTNFWRFRVGIGRDQTDPAAYVLQKLPSQEIKYWSEDQGIELVASAMEGVARKGG